LETASFSLLEQRICTLYSVPKTERTKICFIDDEKDLVTMSSDEEFLYALDLIKPTVRLVVTLVPAVTQLAENVEGTVERSVPYSRGVGRGQFRAYKQGWKEEKNKREFPALTKQERIQRKITAISERKQHIESLLKNDLPPQRERTLNWRLEKLQNKLENLNLALLSYTVPQTPLPENGNPVPTRRGGCGGRGGRRGRGGCGRNFEIDEQIFVNLRTCRQKLREARSSGNQEEIEKCVVALDETKFQIWEAKDKSKPFSEQKRHKRECLKNLREAKASGEKERIEECARLLTAAREALQKVKLGEC